MERIRPSRDEIVLGENLEVLPRFADESFQLIYIDPPFNTGRKQRRLTLATVPDEDGDRVGFNGRRYRSELLNESSYHNEIVWAYDYGARAKRRWPAKHDTILVYVRDPERYWFDSEVVDREPYMAPGLVTAEKAARGKLPTDVWWHTIVSPTGKEKTGYPSQKPLGVLRRIVQASSRSGDWCLDFFAGSGTLGVAAAELGRRYVLIDENPEAIRVMRTRLEAEGSLSVCER